MQTSVDQGLAQVLRKGKQFLLYYWHPSCSSCKTSGDKSWRRKEGWDCDCNKQYICDHML